ncbi:MAG: hypothetical protein OWT27_07045 [Firmicutes bacterium]|nr:hypothetical protein [Bacillota bacterium]
MELIRPGQSRAVEPPLVGRLVYGQPMGGPWDVRNAAWARALAGAGNERGNVLEVGPLPFALRAVCPLLAGIAGAARSVRVRRGGSDGFAHIGRPADIRAVRLDAGDELWLGAASEGMNTYVASTDLTGIAHRRKIASSSIDPAGALRTAAGWAPVALHRGERTRLASRSVTLRVVEGPEWPRGVTDDDLRFSVRPELDRQGVRLAVASLSASSAAAKMPAAVPSSPTVPGLIQWPRQGDPVILGPDCQTVGGYPRLAVVVSADVRLVGSLRPGDTVALARVSLLQAADLWSCEQHGTRRLSRLFRAIAQSWYDAG